VPTTLSAREPALGPLFGVLIGSAAAFAVLQGIVAPVLPILQHDFDTDQSTVTWVLTAYLLSASVLTPILGRAGDVLGKKRMLLGSLVALGLGCVVAALAPNIYVLITARVIQGAGGAVLPLAFGIIRDVYPRDQVAGKVGSIAAISAVGAGLGSVLAGPVLDTLGLDWLFWLPAIIIAVAVLAAWRFVPDIPVEGGGRVNTAAAFLLSGWLVALLLGVSRGSSWGWSSPKVLGLLGAAVVLAGCWVAFESRSDNPLIDMRTMRLRGVWTANLAAVLFGLGMYALVGFLPAFVQTSPSAGYGFGASVTGSALFALPQSLAMFAVGMFAAPIGRRIGPRNALIAGSFISSAGTLYLALFHDAAWQVYAALAVNGAGLGLAFSAMAMVIVGAVPAAQTGVASGMNANIRTIGGSLGAAIMASIVTTHTSGTGVPLEHGYTLGFVVLAVATALAGLAGFLIPRNPVREPTTAPVHHPVPHPELALVAAGTVVDDQDSPGHE
jgi:MFS family permease